jgi:3-(3-hydroxy-phenyl)propionate hydroxylase
MATYNYPKFDYRAPTDLMTGAPQRRPLVVIGAGPMGLAAAIDARLQGLEVLLFDEEDSVSFGSRAVCYAKRTLEILGPPGRGRHHGGQGVSLERGQGVLQEEEVYRSTCCPRPATSARHDQPAAVLPGERW